MPRDNTKPKKRDPSYFARVAIDGVSQEDWDEIVKEAIQGARAGEKYARAWLSKHCGLDAVAEGGEIGKVTLFTFVPATTQKGDDDV